MQIESKIRRKNGTNIDLGQNQYRFAPNAEGAHVCDVEDEDDIARLLSIPEGFKIYRPAEVAKEQKAVLEEDVDGDGDVDRADLVAAYEAKFGKKPHHKMKADKIRAELADE